MASTNISESGIKNVLSKNSTFNILKKIPKNVQRIPQNKAMLKHPIKTNERGEREHFMKIVNI